MVNEPTIFRGTIKITIDGDKKEKFLDVDATALEHHCAIVLKNEQRPTTLINFGEL